MFKKQFEIRWSDIDANKHLANTAYINYMSHTRMAFFNHYGLSLEIMTINELAPVVFYEHVFYFKEAHIGEPITVTLDVLGVSEDGMFFLFEHNFYNDKGENLASCEILGAWMGFTSRKLLRNDKTLMKIISKLPKGKNFKYLTKEDTRKYNKRPINISL